MSQRVWKPPAELRAHSTRGMAALWAEFQGVTPELICRAATWETFSTFLSHYEVDLIVGLNDSAVWPLSNGGNCLKQKKKIKKQTKKIYVRRPVWWSEFMGGARGVFKQPAHLWCLSVSCARYTSLGRLFDIPASASSCLASSRIRYSVLKTFEVRVFRSYFVPRVWLGCRR